VYRATDGLLVNLEAVRRGYGQVAKRVAFKLRDPFLAEEQRARDGRSGLWAPGSTDEYARIEAERQKRVAEAAARRLEEWRRRIEAEAIAKRERVAREEALRQEWFWRRRAEMLEMQMWAARAQRVMTPSEFLSWRLFPDAGQVVRKEIDARRGREPGYCRHCGRNDWGDCQEK
jgi:hypothetical protein